MPFDPTGLVLVCACLALAVLQGLSRRRIRKASARLAAAGVRSALPSLRDEILLWGGGLVHVDWRSRGTDIRVVFVAGGKTFVVRVSGAASHAEAVLAAVDLIRDARIAGHPDPAPDAAGEDAAGETPLGTGSWRDVLGLGPMASLREAEASWRRLARDNHPDLGGDPARMAAINSARDEARRALG